MTEHIIEDVEDLFPHKPGGMIDRHRQHEAQREQARKAAENAAEPVAETAFKAVKVTELSPDILVPVTYTIPPNGRAAILPKSEYRYRAVILVITPGGVILLAKNESAALGGIGFTLTAGIPLPVHTRALMTAVNTTGAPVQVSVVQELYAPER